MSDEQQQQDQPDQPQQDQGQQSDEAHERNIQALPSIAQWKAPWEDNINKPFPVESPLEQVIRTQGDPREGQQSESQQPQPA